MPERFVSKQENSQEIDRRKLKEIALEMINIIEASPAVQTARKFDKLNAYMGESVNDALKLRITAAVLQHPDVKLDVALRDLLTSLEN